jgi:hypothetical protein
MENKTEMINEIVVFNGLKKNKGAKKTRLIKEVDKGKAHENVSTHTIDQPKSIYDLFWEKQRGGKPSQLERYEQHNSPAGILQFIKIGGGPKMGTMCEKFARHQFSSLKKRDKGKNTGYDHKISLESNDIYIEQKSSGHWGESDYKWQHIEEKHKWNILLLCGIDYNDIQFWVMNRTIFNKLVEEKKITNQGNKTGESSEGMWFNYSDVAETLIQIKTNDELLQYVNTL